MKVLIVDDESFMLMSLKTSFDWAAHGFEVVGEAKNGQDALTKIEQLAPDIMLLDIKMPVMDGLQTLARLQGKNRVPKVIMLSSYKEFEYVREGMRLGALDYIHKPSLDEAAMFEVLQRTREAIMRERKSKDEINSLRESAERVKPSMKNVFFKEWAEGAARHQWEIEQKVKAYDIQLKAPNLVCFAMQIDHFPQVKSRYKKDTEYLLYFSVQNVMSEILRKYDEVEFFQQDKERFAILKTYSRLRSSQEIYSEGWNLIKNVQQALRKFLNISVSFGVSALHDRLLAMPHALREANAELDGKFYEQEGCVCFYKRENAEQKEAEPDTDTTLQGHVLDKLQLIKQEIEREQWPAVRQSMERLFEELGRNRQLSRHEMLRVATYLHYLFSRAYEGEDGLPLPEFPTMEEFATTETRQQIYQLLLKEMELVRNKRTQRSPQNKNHKIRLVLDYIHDYYDRDLNLEELSHYVEVNSSYLSRLFKEQTGMSLIQYINQYRINKSLHLLLGSTMKTYEIAEQVGFKSTDNFYIAFKKMIGYPPNEIRKNPDLVSDQTLK